MVLVRPLTNLTDNPKENYLSIGQTTGLTHALSHYREIRILERTPSNQQ
jgi:TolB-like protein